MIIIIIRILKTKINLFGIWYFNPPGLESDILIPPGLESDILIPPGLESDILILPGFKSEEIVIWDFNPSSLASEM